jgi:hypothetical protein
MKRTIIAFILIGLSGLIFGGLVAAALDQKPEVQYSYVPGPYGTMKLAPGHGVHMSGTNNTLDQRSGETDQGKAWGDKTSIKPGAQTFSLAAMMGSTAKGSYLAEHIVKSAWLICLIGLVIAGLGVTLILVPIPGTTAFGLPLLIIGGIVFAGGLVAMMFESMNGLAILLLILPIVGYYIYKHYFAGKTAAAATAQADDLTTAILDLASHATAANWPTVQAKLDALKAKLGA